MPNIYDEIEKGAEVKRVDGNINDVIASGVEVKRIDGNV